MPTLTLYPKNQIILDTVLRDYRGTPGSTLTMRNSSKSPTSEPIYACNFDIPASVKWVKINSVDVYFYSRTISSSGIYNQYSATLDVYVIKIPFSFSSGAYRDITSSERYGYIDWRSSSSAIPSYQKAYVSGYSSRLPEYLGFMANGIYTRYSDVGIPASDNLVVDTASGSNKPYIVVNYDAGTVTITPNNISPAGGYVDDRVSKAFVWSYKLSADIADPEGYLAASRFVFEWKNASGTTRTIAATPSGVTIPANTFPATGDFQARVVITDPEGRVSSSSWATYTTTEAIPTATATAPVNTVENDVDPVKFRWQHKISTGTEQTAAELQYSTDNINWYSLGSVSGNAASLDVKLSDIPAGTVYWRVRTANTDNAFSEWSAAKSFVLVAAPPTPIISVDPVPLTTISWQADVQQAYRLTIDGAVHSAQFGPASSYTVREPLTDGVHTASVEVQGTFGLWSAPAELVFTIKNSPGALVTLAAENGIDAFLTWTNAATDAVFFVYRDGQLISKTRKTQMIDRLAAGNHEYFVLAVMPNGYYSRSNTAEAESGSDTLVIADIAGGSYLDISHTPDSNGTQDFSWRRTHTLRHFSGAKLPVIELSEFEDETASYRTAMFSTDDAKAFEKLKGKICIVKSRRREAVVAAMVRLQKIIGNFFVTYDFEMQRIEWEDFIDDTYS